MSSISVPILYRDVIRPEDLLVARLMFGNGSVVVDDRQAQWIVATEPKYPLVVMLELQPQHLVEYAYQEDEALATPALARLSGPSTLSWQLPAETRLPLVLDEILALLSARPLVRGGPTEGESTLLPGTVIELPQGLFLGPKAALLPVFSAPPESRRELWRVTLRTPAEEPLELVRRFVHRIDAPADPLLPGRALGRGDRWHIGHNADRAVAEDEEYWTIRARRLQLSALGASYDLRGEWLRKDSQAPTSGPDDVLVGAWIQQGTLGRDHFVKVVRNGTLLPLGHRASLIRVSERQFAAPDFAGGAGAEAPAALRTRQFMVVRQRVVDIPRGAPRDLPFTAIELLGESTPELADSGDSTEFWVRDLAGRDVQFACAGRDLTGEIVRWDMPLVFVGGADTAAAIDLYIRDAAAVPLSGQTIGYAVAADPTHDQGRLPTRTLTFLPVAQPGFPHYRPTLATADVEIVALREMGGGGVAAIQYSPAWKDPNQPPDLYGVFAQVLADSKSDFARAADRVGGLVTPNMQVRGLSLSAGPIGVSSLFDEDRDEFNFDPAAFFEGARLLGAVDLKDILARIAGPALDKLPRFLSQSLSQGAALIAKLRRIKDDLAAAISTIGSSADAAAQTFVAELDGAAFAEFTAGFLDAAGRALAGDPTGLDAIAGAAAAMHARVTALVGAIDAKLGSLAAQMVAVAQGTVAHGPVHEARRTLEGIRGVGREVLPLVAQAAQLIEQVAAAREHRVVFQWSPDLCSYSYLRPPTSPTDYIFQLGDAPPGRLRLRAELRGGRTGGAQLGAEAGMSGEARLENFTINLIPPVHFLSLHFKHIAFTMRAGSPPEIDVAFREKDGIEFAGPLKFVVALASLIPFKGFSDPPGIEVTPRGITASFSVGLPNVAVGIFALKNMTLGAALNLPFIGDTLTLDFWFSRRTSPFLLSIGPFGGGGYFGVQLAPDPQEALRTLEAGFEFGASLALDVGVASGEVHIMGGIYYKKTGFGKGATTELTAYLRLGGSLNVLGLVSLSMELLLQLRYYPSQDKLFGRAKLTLSIKVLFFSASFETEVERRLSGTANDPTFEDFMKPYEVGPGDPFVGEGKRVDPWWLYCDAFARARAAPSAITEASVRVDASALTSHSFLVPGVHTTWQATATSLWFTAAPREFGLQFPSGVVSATFSITPAGAIAYAARWEGILVGAGTAELVIRGVRIVVDATALTTESLIVPGVHYTWTDAHRPQTIRVLPGSYGLQFRHGVPEVAWTVTDEGTVDYEPRWEGLLVGRGSDTLIIKGRAVTVDATALTTESLIVPGVHYTWTDAHRPQPVAAPPGSYGLQFRHGVPDVRWTLTAAGTITYDAIFKEVLGGEGTTTLMIKGRTITVDATALTTDSLIVPGVHYTWTDAHEPQPITALPGSYGLQFRHGVPDLRWTLTAAGAVTYDPIYKEILGGEGTTTLIVRGRTITIDARPTRTDACIVNGVDYTWVDATAPRQVTLMPGTYSVQLRWGTQPQLFTVGLDGRVTYDRAHDGVFAGFDTTTLVLAFPKP